MRFSLPVLPEPSLRSLPSSRAIAWTMAVALAVFTIAAVATLTVNGGRGAGAGAPGRTLAVDLWAARRAASLRAPALTPLAWSLTHAGGTIGLTLLTAAIAPALALRGLGAQAVILVASMSGASILTLALKGVFSRPRLGAEFRLGPPLRTAAFPSGHSLNTAVFMALLAGFVLISAASRAARAGAVAAALVVTAAVGASRVYLGYHRLTEILAGWALGLAWACATALVVIALSRQRPRRAITHP
ncbi:phosphatase PAP2 family protein [Actinomyces gaoshouyii]|uniref:phosphatase PAP2 family protein n=1 Tax=Actinomyces gaoshouyii TaxID=1960083 RepID=UPI000F77836D|nr:phosphatase PAP2 family protein [Actinomyces gaoshouyii]